MNWTELTISARPGELEQVCDRLVALGCGTFSVEDETDFLSFLENGRQYWDYVDEELAASMKGVSRVLVYLQTRKQAEDIAINFPGQGISFRTVREEDWENCWKKYYKPLKIGEKLLITPEWESPDAEGRAVLRLDPGTMFGTGSHATTRLCLEALEQEITGGEHVLDLGCGSGILSIAALLLGAKNALGVDVDPRGKNISRENAARNGVGEKYSAITGDVINGALPGAESCFDLVLANIVADVIIALAPVVPKLLSENGRFICSGVIDSRGAETETALKAVFPTVTSRASDGWLSFLCY